MSVYTANVSYLPICLSLFSFVVVLCCVINLFVFLKSWQGYTAATLLVRIIIWLNKCEPTFQNELDGY